MANLSLNSHVFLYPSSTEIYGYGGSVGGGSVGGGSVGGGSGVFVGGGGCVFVGGTGVFVGGISGMLVGCNSGGLVGGISDGKEFIVAATAALTKSFSCCVSAIAVCMLPCEISSDAEQAFRNNTAISGRICRKYFFIFCFLL